MRKQDMNDIFQVKYCHSCGSYFLFFFPIIKSQWNVKLILLISRLVIVMLPHPKQCTNTLIRIVAEDLEV